MDSKTTTSDLLIPEIKLRERFDLFCTRNKYLVVNLVSRNLKVKYRRSIFGIFWTLLSPLASTAVFYLIFKLVLHDTTPHYVAFILSGMLPWNFFIQTVAEGLESVVGNGALISKVPVPIHIFPYVGTVTNLVSLILATPLLFLAMYLTGATISWPILLLPYYYVVLFLITYSISTLFGVGFVYFRDLRHIISIVLQLWFYLTPVFYDEERYTGIFRSLIYINPLGTIFSGIHDITTRGIWPSIDMLLISTGWAALLVSTMVAVQYFLVRELPERI